MIGMKIKKVVVTSRDFNLILIKASSGLSTGRTFYLKWNVYGVFDKYHAMPLETVDWHDGMVKEATREYTV